MSHTDPEYLAELEKETEFLNSKGRRGNDRIALKEPGDSALVRLVPYQFDDKGRWYARVARHWINQRPYICTRDTDVAHGGDPDGRCEICDTVDKLNRDRDKRVSQLAYKMTSVPQYLTMAVLIETMSAGGQRVGYKGNDLKKAKELWLYKEAFQDVMTIFKTFLRRTDSKLSILDPVAGCDLMMSKSRRGLRFDREDPLPLAPKSANPEEFIESVLKSISWKPDEPVHGDDLDDLLLKIEDTCLDRRSSRGDEDRRGGGRDDDRGRGRDDDRGRGRSDDDRARPASRSRDDSPADDRRRDDPPARSRDESRSTSRRDDPPARDDRRRDDPPADDRRSSRREEPPADDRRTPARDDRAPARDDRDDRRSTSRRDDPPARSRNEDHDDRRGTSTGGGDDRHPDLEADSRGASRDMDEEQDERPPSIRRGDTDQDDPPPPIRSGRREVTPPPAAVTGGSRPTAPSTPSRQEQEDDADPLPEGDKDKAPATPPAEGEVVQPPKTPAAETPANRGSSLTSSIRDRVKRHDAPRS